MDMDYIHWIHINQLAGQPPAQKPLSKIFKDTNG